MIMKCSMELRALREVTYCLYIYSIINKTVLMPIRRKLAVYPTRLDLAWHLPTVEGTPFDQSVQFG